MKFYCDKCKCELKISQEVIDAWEKEDKDWTDDSGLEGTGVYYEKYEKWDGKHVLCDICSNESQEVWMDLIPDWETPEQYEKRTGNPVASNTATWSRYSKFGYDWSEPWVLTGLECTGQLKRSYGYDRVQVVIADPPVPPPDGWEPGKEE